MSATEPPVNNSNLDTANALAVASHHQRRDEAARRLALMHYEIEPGMFKIFRIRTEEPAEEKHEEPIKLLEVNEATVPTGILPLKFGPLPEDGIDYPSIIVEVTPAEYEALRQGRLQLPGHWRIEDELSRSESDQAVPP